MSGYYLYEDVLVQNNVLIIYPVGSSTTRGFEVRTYILDIANPEVWRVWPWTVVDPSTYMVSFYI